MNEEIKVGRIIRVYRTDGQVAGSHGEISHICPGGESVIVHIPPMQSVKVLVKNIGPASPRYFEAGERLDALHKAMRDEEELAETNKQEQLAEYQRSKIL